MSFKCSFENRFRTVDHVEGVGTFLETLALFQTKFPDFNGGK